MYFKGLVGKKFFFCFKLNYCPTQIPTYAAPHLVVVEYLNALPPTSVCQSEVSFLRSTCVKAGWSAGRGRFHLSRRSSCHLWSSNSILRTIKLNTVNYKTNSEFLIHVSKPFSYDSKKCCTIREKLSIYIVSSFSTEHCSRALTSPRQQLPTVTYNYSPALMGSADLKGHSGIFEVGSYDLTCWYTRWLAETPVLCPWATWRRCECVSVDCMLPNSQELPK